jgi:HAD superfamily hydrolase (TIGR01509 family)
MNPDLYVFDIGNVLLGFDPNRLGRNLDRIEPGKGPAVVHDIWDGPWMNRLETGKIGGRELFDHVRRRHGLKVSQSSFLRAFCEIFKPLKENLALFLRLTRTRRVALLSNICEVHWTYIRRRYPVLKRAQVPCASFELGIMKPDVRAYRAVADRSGVPLRRMAYVDDRAPFIQAARRLGMTAIHYTGERPLSDLFREAGFVLNGK